MKISAPQSIPSIHSQLYKTTLQEARQIRGGWYAIKRTGFSLPINKGFKIRGLGFHDYDSHCTKKQSAHRRLFAAATDCFGEQPMVGGVNWGEQGVISREKWWIAAIPSGLWYYDYFMKENLNVIKQARAPLWWERYQNCCVEIEEDDPNQEGYNRDFCSVIGSHSGGRKYVILKKPENMKYLYIHQARCYYPDLEERTVHVEIHALDVPIDDLPMTWDQHHAAIEDIGTRIDDFYIQSDTSMWTYLTVWRRFLIPSCQAIAFVIVGDSIDPTLLINFDGPDGAQNYTAETGQEITFTGTAQIDTAIKKFGSGSLLLPAYGDHVSVPNNTNLNFGSNKFTFGFWVYGQSPYQRMFRPYWRQTPGGGDYDRPDLEIQLYMGWRLVFRNIYVESAYPYNTRWNIGFYVLLTGWTNGWNYIEIDRSGSSWYVFMNGVSKTPFVELEGPENDHNYAGAIMDGSGDVWIGKQDGTIPFNHYIDSYMIDIGKAWHTSNFTPPSTPYEIAGGPPILKFDGAGYDCDVSLSPWWAERGKILPSELPERRLT